MNNKSESQLLEAVRGKRMDEITALANWWTWVHKKDTDESKKEVASLTKKIKEMKWDYSKIHFSNYFRVDQAISLVDFGFLGPFKDEKAEYMVHLELFEPRKAKEVFPSSSSRLVAGHWTKINARKCEDFYAGFGKPISLKANQWYLIQFMRTVLIPGDWIKLCRMQTFQ